MHYDIQDIKEKSSIVLSRIGIFIPKKDVKYRDDYCKNDGDTGGFIRRNHGLEELIPLNFNIEEEGESSGRIGTTTVSPNQLENK